MKRAIICFGIALGGMLLQYWQTGYQHWFQLEDIHHETFIVMFVALGVGILIGGRR
ncbi:hypothetical protein LCGC14_1314050 [marine sediment metagenome]|uniref:Uncharacterized protein n=1 Tax=marine sediment metagenome TaxID=412755 RepID=A0A0F9N2G5_9ZZZZ